MAKEMVMERIDRLIREAPPDAAEVAIPISGVGEETVETVMAELQKARYNLAIVPDLRKGGKNAFVVIGLNPPVRRGPTPMSPPPTAPSPPEAT